MTSVTTAIGRNWRGLLRRTDASSPQPTYDGEVVLRLSRVTDREALERLAALESRRLPGGSFVVAIADGELVVAVPLDERAPVLADPFHPTTPLVALANRRARDLRRADARTSVGRAHMLIRAY